MTTATAIGGFRPNRALVQSFLAIALAATAASAAVVPGTRVELVPPEDFVPSKVFPGFEHPESGASIMVTEMAAPAPEVLKALTAENLATKQMTLLEAETVRFGGFDGQVVVVTQPAYGTVFAKVLGGFGDESVTVLVVASYPEEKAVTLARPLREAVLSARLQAQSKPGLFDGLDFRVADGPSMKVSERVSTMVLLTRGGKKGPLGPGEPLLVIGTSLAPAPVGDPEAFAQVRVRQIEQVDQLEGFAGGWVEVGGRRGYELTASAREKSSGVPVRVYLVVVPRGELYLIAVGLVAADAAEATFEEFRAIVRTIK